MATSNAVDEHGASELENWIFNTQSIYRQWQAIVKNLWKHKARGNYSISRAADGFMYVVDAAAKDYIKNFGDRGARIDSMFNKSTRRQVAVELVESFEKNHHDEKQYAPPEKPAKPSKPAKAAKVTTGIVMGRECKK